MRLAAALMESFANLMSSPDVPEERRQRQYRRYVAEQKRLAANSTRAHPPEDQPSRQQNRAAARRQAKRERSEFLRAARRPKFKARRGRTTPAARDWRTWLSK